MDRRLESAIRDGDLRRVEQQISYGAVPFVDSLVAAVDINHPVMIARLITQHNLNINIDNAGKKALQRAVQLGFNAAIMALIACGVDPKADNHAALLSSANTGKMETFELLLSYYRNDEIAAIIDQQTLPPDMMALAQHRSLNDKLVSPRRPPHF